MVFEALKQSEIIGSESNQDFRSRSQFLGQENEELVSQKGTRSGCCPGAEFKTPFLPGGEPSRLVAKKIPLPRDLAEHLAETLGSISDRYGFCRTQGSYAVS